MTKLHEITGQIELPFVIEVTKEVILSELQSQVESVIDPASLAFDAEGFEWEEGEIVMDVLFKDRKGLARGKVYLQPSTNERLDLCFVVAARFLSYMAASRGAS